TVGATPRQARRLVLGEALAVAVAAALAGSALGTVIAGPFARWLGRAGFAPRDFTAHFILWPLLAASGAGLLIALAGAFIAARRAAGRAGAGGAGPWGGGPGPAARCRCPGGPSRWLRWAAGRPCSGCLRAPTRRTAPLSSCRSRCCWSGVSRCGRRC